MRRFEYKDQKSDKFWQIERNGRELTAHWGHIGTTGQSKSKDFADEASAEASLAKQIEEKRGKGYQEVAAGQSLPAAGLAASPKATQTPAATIPEPGLAPEPAQPPEAPAAPSVPPPVPGPDNPDAPWLAGQPAYILPTKCFPGSYYKVFKTLPSRRNPVEFDSKAAAIPGGDLLNTLLNEGTKLCVEKSAPAWQPAVKEAELCLGNHLKLTVISQEATAVIIAVVTSDWFYSPYYQKYSAYSHSRDIDSFA